MTNEMKETLRTLEIFLRGRIPPKGSSSQPTKALKLCEKATVVCKLCLVAQFLSGQPPSEINKSCLQKKRSKIQATCTAKNLDFTTIEKLAEENMSEGEKRFYHECIKDQS